MYKDIIGILGGFGGYATLGFYRRILEEFASEKESGYPHIIIDNDFTMPSRTRALLYGENYNVIINRIVKSLQYLIDGGATHIILCCGTAHAFLDDVYDLFPIGKKYVVNIIEILGTELRELRVGSVSIIAAEGTLQSSLYSKYLMKYGIYGQEPGSESFTNIRKYIEFVKKNDFSYKIAEDFICFLMSLSYRDIVLGCTEFPELVQYINSIKLDGTLKNMWKQFRFFDPLESCLRYLKYHMS